MSQPMKHKTLHILLSLIGITTYSQESLDELLKKHNNDNIPYISVTELHQLQSQDKVLILDSREKKEFDVSHIPSAILIGYNQFSVEEISGNILDKETPIVVYCTLGIRSNVNANKLQKEGFTNVTNLYGGICEWKNNGYTVIDPSGNETENVHLFSEKWNKWLKNGTAVYE